MLLSIILVLMDNFFLQFRAGPSNGQFVLSGGKNGPTIHRHGGTFGIIALGPLADVPSFQK